MGLGFLVPAFLAGLAALALPVFFHLRHREKDKPHRFPSLMFLRRIPIRTAQRRRITDWLLLLLRAGAVALLVAAFARPFLGRSVGAIAAAPAQRVVLVLDRSLSMGHRDVWPVAKDSARKIVAALRPNGRIAVILFDEEAEVVQPFTTDRALALAAVERAQPSTRGTRYAAALRAARRVVADSGSGPAEILVVSDLQRSGFEGLAGLELPADLDVRAVSVVPARRPNGAVISADVQRVETGPQSRLLVSARIASRDQLARKAQLTLIVNGRNVGSRAVILPADGAISAAFDPVALPKGRATGTVALEADALVADDSLRFVVPAEAALRVLMVVPGDAPSGETLFLERALAIGRAPQFAVDRRPPGALTARDLAGTSLVLGFDTPIPQSTALDQWVRAGGGLVVAAGRRLATRGSRSSLLPGAITGVVERMNDRGGSFGEVSLEHPVFTPFRAAGTGALGAARFLRYPRIRPDSGATVIASFDDGAPAVIEHTVGLGRVLLIAAPLDAEAGDFPLQPIFLPFVRRVAVYSAGYASPPLWSNTGETALVAAVLRNPVVATPSGALLRPAADSGGGAVALREAGFYDVYEGRATGEPAQILAVNPPPAESDLSTADARELLLGVKRSDSTRVDRAGAELSAERESRQSIWRLLLAAMALLLVVETIVANRGWRGTASVVLPAPPERSTP